MDPRLQQAIENDDVDELHRLIVEDRKLLDRASKDPFPNTPLHVAAAAGKTQVAMELAILKPSFAWKLNLEGYSPMHLALQHEHYHIMKALMTLGTKFIRIRGRCGITPLHYVAGKEGDNEVELLAEFLSACKSSIEDLTSRCETAVHIAVKNHNIQAFKVLFGWLKRVYLTEILNWKDEVGNTVLHIAVSERQPEIIELLIGYININAKNFQNKTALEIFQDNPSGNQDLADRLHRVGSAAKPPTLNLPLSQFLSMELTCFEKFTFWFGLRDESARSIILVVAALVTTATYQAALTPPGGYWGDNSSNAPANSTVVTANSSGIAVEKPHKAGNIILGGSRLYQFTALNSLVFLASIMTIWITAIPQLPHTVTVYGLMAFVGLAYFTTLIIEFPNPYALTGRLLSVFYMILLCVVLAVPLRLWSNDNRIRRRIDATGRRIGNFQN